MSSKKQRKAAEKDKGVSLHPIPFEEAVGDLLKVKPRDRQNRSKESLGKAKKRRSK